MGRKLKTAAAAAAAAAAVAVVAANLYPKDVPLLFLRAICRSRLEELKQIWLLVCRRLFTIRREKKRQDRTGQDKTGHVGEWEWYWKGENDTVEKWVE